ncbi:2Fe-2S iron-sulfur cluster-binding protein [Phreatobacter oligotrophus]|nr:2Fe-2S iron-sulfur cluster-binding protein [Phreatobacter oligotrophus]
MHRSQQRGLASSMIGASEPAAEELRALHEKAQSWITRSLPAILAAADDIAASTARGDYTSARASAGALREATARLESGLSAHIGMAQGRAPRDIALAWYRSEMQLQGAQPEAPALFGFTVRHLSLMAVLTLVLAGLLLIQLLRARRAAALIALARMPSVAQEATTAVSVAGLGESVAPADDRSSDTILPPRLGGSRAPWRGELRVIQIFDETPSIKTFRLAEPSGGPLPFDYLPGQFMQVTVTLGGDNAVRRAYTIASSPTHSAFVELTIKNEQQGQVSRHLHENVHVGSLLTCSAPYGDFTFTGLDEDCVVLIGGGVGATPLMSVLRFLTDRAWPGEIYFIYGARGTDEFVFRDELEFLQRRHTNLHVLGAMPRSPHTSWFGWEGAITRELLAATVPDIANKRIHMCGPPAMMRAVTDALTSLGVPPGKIHTEAFGPAARDPADLAPARPSPAEVAAISLTSPKAASKPRAKAPKAAPATVSFLRSGRSTALDSGMTVLAAAEASGVEIPSSCRVGICGVCKVRLVEGKVQMDVTDGLSDTDAAEGLVLACQAKATTPHLAIDA